MQIGFKHLNLKPKAFKCLEQNFILNFRLHFIDYLYRSEIGLKFLLIKEVCKYNKMKL